MTVNLEQGWAAGPDGLWPMMWRLSQRWALVVLGKEIDRARDLGHTALEVRLVRLREEMQAHGVELRHYLLWEFVPVAAAAHPPARAAEPPPGRDAIAAPELVRLE